MDYGDKVLTCVDCGKLFLFTAKEQKFFAQKGLVEPKRCRVCRHYRKEQQKQSKTPPIRNGGNEAQDDKKKGVGCGLASFITLVISGAVIYYGVQQGWNGNWSFWVFGLLLFIGVGSLISLIANIFIYGNTLLKRTIAIILGVLAFTVGAVLPFFIPAVFILRINLFPIPIPYLGNLFLVGLSVALLYYGIRGEW
jgi:hypothetical protein